MFTLNPGGGVAGGGKSGGAVSQLTQNLWFFGQLSVYFLVLRGAFVFFSARDDRLHHHQHHSN
jgi:hypothetical protein